MKNKNANTTTATLPLTPAAAQPARPAPIVALEPETDETLRAAAVSDFEDRCLKSLTGLMSDVDRLTVLNNVRTKIGARLIERKNEIEKALAVLGVVPSAPITPSTPAKRAPKSTSEVSGGTAEKILAALKTGNKTVKELIEAAGTKWINVTMSKLMDSKQIKSDGKRPATYSLV